MTTVVEALQAATDELHNAALVYGTRADQVATQLASFKSSAQTIVNNYVNRTPSIDIVLDANNGVDAPDRGSLTSPMRTIEYALENRDKSVTLNLYLLTDQVLTRTHSVLERLNISGIVLLKGPYGAPYQSANRKLTFASEAGDSPNLFVGRCIPFLDMAGDYAAFGYIDFVLPTPPAGIQFPYAFALRGGNYVFDHCSISCDSAGSAAKLLTAIDGSRSTFSFSAFTLGPNGPGKLFNGVAAGANPSSSFNYDTNLTSA